MPMPGSARSRPKLSASALLFVAVVAGGAGEALLPYRVDGDRIDAPLTGRPGDPARGRALLLDLHGSTCLLCHSAPLPELHFSSTIWPSLAGVGDRLSEGQIRLRLVDASVVNPETVMPRFYAVTGLTRVAPAYAGRPVLDAAQIEDLVAFLTTLRAP
ncbi:MAG: sulfur oxidation c-type cytochrome SoxX [Acetobacteraceae bacterium]|nr:sulfur oxidation c-type cytochrome SoxX [Acetobacteraceae bacterium]